jgi:hypothetical protein
MINIITECVCADEVVTKTTQRVGCERGCYKTNTNGECASVQAWLQQTKTKDGCAGFVVTNKYGDRAYEVGCHRRIQ